MKPPFDAVAEVARLVAQGKAVDLLTAYSDHNQSCAYVMGIVEHTASEPDTTQLVTAQQFARNLLDDWSK